ncbi:histidine kinase [Conexibacter sp. JD483]|uniref:sensor histidine kinase n=1 Tax=unclassified Conexibacter TaxID=2627773 RepID=UPI002728F625|nr:MULTISPECIES: histidine kinase [unclassified Conexibacter]MDO8184617.1 histidine kinase [Conexibacter sp. CPCC 205706]MDO8197923.1 histidine kinase [Conexibacter sp. CPCC 205762]MDR9370112.1 histidine kinase [Conexibacter sp. JD483]
MSMLERARAWAARHPLAVDGLGLTLLLALAVAWGEPRPPRAGWLVPAAMVLPLAVRRRWPVPVFALVAIAAFVQWLTLEISIADLSLLIAIYTVAAHERRRWLVVAAVAVLELGCLLAAARWSGAGALSPAFLTLSACTVAATVLGVYVRTRREQLAALHERAAQLERERDQEAALAAAAERARIARELHDVVAHSLSVMVALADGARLTRASDPAQADAAVANVAATGREALGEMRRLLGVLRRDGDAPLAPQPGLAQLEALLEDSRAAGLPTRLTVTGEPRPLGPGAELALYRVVQEALTNTRKHARDASRAEVTLRWEDDAVTVVVSDDGASALQPEGGHGLAGMRERLALFDGTVEAGPRPQGGWCVCAGLPR